MTAPIIRLPIQIIRAWVLIESEPGTWHAKLRQQKGPVARRTEKANWLLVSETIRDLADGLLVLEIPYSRGRAA